MFFPFRLGYFSEEGKFHTNYAAGPKARLSFDNKRDGQNFAHPWTPSSVLSQNSAELRSLRVNLVEGTRYLLLI